MKAAYTANQVGHPCGQPKWAEIKEVMRGYNNIADGWAGASNSHTHPILSPERILNAGFPFFRLNDPGRADGRTKPLIEMRIRN